MGSLHNAEHFTGITELKSVTKSFDNRPIDLALLVKPEEFIIEFDVTSGLLTTVYKVYGTIAINECQRYSATLLSI